MDPTLGGEFIPSIVQVSNPGGRAMITAIKSCNKHKQRKTNMSKYNKLYTPPDSAIAFIDHQPQMTFGVANIDRATLINNVTLLAKVAKEFKVPAVLTAVETESFSGYVWPDARCVEPGGARNSLAPVLQRKPRK